MYMFSELMNGYHGARIRNKADEVFITTKDKNYSVKRGSSDLLYFKKLERLEKMLGNRPVKYCDYYEKDNSYIIRLGGLES